MSINTVDRNNKEAPVRIIDTAEDYAFRNILRVVRARLQFRRLDGRMSQEVTRISCERGDSVGILLYNPAVDEIILTRQFRYSVYASLEPETILEDGGMQAWFLEIVAGVIDPGRSAAEIASKEILEEAGYLVGEDLQPIATMYPSPGWITERIFLFLGLVSQEDRASEGGGLASEEEDIEVIALPFQKAMDLVASGEIRDAKTIIALQHLALLKSSGRGF